MRNKRGQVQAAGAKEPAQPVEVKESAVSSPEAAAPVEVVALVENKDHAQVQPKKKSKMWLWIIIGLIAIGVIGALIWFLLIGGEGSVVGNSLGSSAPTPPQFPN